MSCMHTWAYSTSAWFSINFQQFSLRWDFWIGFVSIAILEYCPFVLGSYVCIAFADSILIAIPFYLTSFLKSFRIPSYSLHSFVSCSGNTKPCSNTTDYRPDSLHPSFHSSQSQKSNQDNLLFRWHSRSVIQKAKQINQRFSCRIVVFLQVYDCKCICIVNASLTFVHVQKKLLHYFTTWKLRNRLNNGVLLFLYTDLNKWESWTEPFVGDLHFINDWFVTDFCQWGIALFSCFSLHVAL